MFKLKKLIQNIIRQFNLLFFQKEIPSKIAIYFHQTSQKEIDDIEKLIVFFKFNGFKFLTIKEYAQNISSEDKNIAITFDDAFYNWKNILPKLKKHDVKATFFINSIALTSENPSQFLKNINQANSLKILNKKILQEILEDGHEVGGHTHNHQKLKKLNVIDFQNEIQMNLKIMEKEGIKLNSFAIPYGMRRFVKSEQLDYLNFYFDSICFGEPGMLFRKNNKYISRTPWRVEKSFNYNLKNLSTDTQYFNFITKRSGLG